MSILNASNNYKKIKNICKKELDKTQTQEIP